MLCESENVAPPCTVISIDIQIPNFRVFSRNLTELQYEMKK